MLNVSYIINSRDKLIQTINALEDDRYKRLCQEALEYALSDIIWEEKSRGFWYIEHQTLEFQNLQELSKEDEKLRGIEHELFHRFDVIMRFIDPNCYYSDDASTGPHGDLNYIAFRESEDCIYLIAYNSSKSIIKFKTQSDMLGCAIFAIWAYFSSDIKNKRQCGGYYKIRNFGVNTFTKISPLYLKRIQSIP